MRKKTAVLAIVNFLVVAIIDILWHGVIFGAYYNAEVGSISRTENGVIVPIVWAVLVSDLLVSIGILWLLLIRRGKTMPMTGAMLDASIFMLIYYFAANLAFYALLPYYPVGPILVDGGMAVITGIVSGLVISGIYNKWTVKLNGNAD